MEISAFPRSVFRQAYPVSRFHFLGGERDSSTSTTMHCWICLSPTAIYIDGSTSAIGVLLGHSDLFYSAMWTEQSLRKCQLQPAADSQRWFRLVGRHSVTFSTTATLTSF